LLAQLLLYPYEAEQGIRYYGFRALSVLITVSSIYAVSFRRLTWIFALLLAIPVALHRSVLLEPTESKVALAGLALGVAFDAFIVVVIFNRVFRARDVTSTTIFGAVSIYLMVGFVFTRIYLFFSCGASAERFLP
jgi:hypothetical protein